MALRAIKVFVASPGDVPFERARLDGVVARLNSAFGSAAQFQCFRWEQNFYKAHQTFQRQIPEPADCDIVIVIFGNRLGSELPEDFGKRLPDGAPYPSGTAYELLSAVAAADLRERPAVYVFRKTSEPQFTVSQKAEWEAATREKERLDAFFERWFRTPSGGFRRSFHTFADPDEFEGQVDALLRQWAEKTLQLEPAWKVGREGSPFPGLRAFDARQSRVFFGRDRKVSRALEELVRASKRPRGRPFLLIVGPSGSGKSSLMRAGLAPRLTAPGVIPEVDLWRIAVMRPAGAATAFAALAEALFVSPISDQPADDPGGFGRALPELADGPYKSPAALVELLEAAPGPAAAAIVAALDAIGEREKSARGASRTSRVDLLLLVDQLEEVFAGAAQDPQRVAFARLLTAAADSQRIWIVATLRADLYGRMLDPTSPFLALKDGGAQYDLASPGEAELTEILRKSAEAAGLVYEKDASSGDSLDDRLLRDAAGADTLPLLQFTLEQLFEQKKIIDTPGGPRAQLTFSAYQALGGLDGAIDKVAEQAIGDPRNRLGDSEIVEALPRLLRRLATQVSDDQAATSGLAALTMRAAPLAEAAPDEASKKLVGVLVRARLLVSASAPQSEPLIRLAHERVLTSWRRARKIVETHRDYFRIRADVEQQRRRWFERGRKREFLLSAGTPLDDAETLVRAYGGELPTTLRDYVAISGRRARGRQRLTAAAAAVFFVVAVIATAFGIVAYGAGQKAERNYAAAKDAADQLVASIAKELRNQKSISSETLDIALNAVDRLIQRIEATVSQQDGFVTRELQTAFAWIENPFHPPAVGGELEALELSRATLLYEFAETYHRTANDLVKARDKAQQSLAIFARLYAGGNTSPELLASIATAQMELGDIERQIVEQTPVLQGVPPDFSSARAHLDAALCILDALTAEFPDRLDWLREYSQVLTRLGDLDQKLGNRAAAADRYAKFFATAVRIFKSAPDDPVAVRELGWGYRKLGELESRAEQAEKMFANEVCIRRRLTSLQPENIQLAQDLGYGLTRLGGARLKRSPADIPGAGDAYFEALHVRLELVGKNSSEKALYSEFAQGLQRVAELYRAKDDSALADAYSLAAKDVIRKTAEAFPDRLPDDENAKASALRQAALLRERGALAMIETSRTIVENSDHEFTAVRLDEIQHEAEGCWDRLRADIAAADRPQTPSMGFAANVSATGSCTP